MRGTGLRLAVTGGMASGKSSVALFLRNRLRAAHVDADQVCRHLLVPNGKGWLALRKAFGAKFFHQDGSLDRRELRRAIFSDPEVRGRVDELIHPLARRVVLEELQRAAVRRLLVLAEVPLLYEAGWEGDFDRVLVVYAEKKTCVRRLAARDAISGEEAAAAVASQMPLPDKALRADHVVDNTGCRLNAILQLLHLAELFRERQRGGKNA